MAAASGERGNGRRGARGLNRHASRKVGFRLCCVAAGFVTKGFRGEAFSWWVLDVNLPLWGEVFYGLGSRRRSPSGPPSKMLPLKGELSA